MFPLPCIHRTCSRFPHLCTRALLGFLPVSNQSAPKAQVVIPTPQLELILFSYRSAVLPVLQVHHSSYCAPRFRVEVLLAPFPGEIVARLVNLAQTSQSCLGETNRDSPKPVCAKGRPGDPLKFLSERTSRPGERGLA
ncbi:hypothetical protein DEO72_LG3g1288 [Vigna unguiculata]|uniref:Uncharacterized protein n=1 Tax=Vigna unguiculata TaxID=3917 RepID=A0A4D6LDS1_VIGUN|nr:hypothetical protein DEO72_LG3g1288 [Vigna unguiculata]